MTLISRVAIVLLPLALALTLGCSGDSTSSPADPTDSADAVGPADSDSPPDAGSDSDDGTPPGDDGTPPDGDTTDNPDVPDPPPTEGEVVTDCKADIAEPASGTCRVTPGGDTLRIRADIMTPDGRLLGGELVIDAQGNISCVACDCSAEAQGATVFECPKALVTPGLINPHDHLGWSQHPPVDHGDERYDHRHEWRKGKNGKTKLSTPGNFWSGGGIWGEMRHLLSGATSIMGSASSAGFLRNLDRNNGLEGLSHESVEAPTFPLGDTGGTLTASGCGNYDLDDPNKIAQEIAYVPHVAEGVIEAAHNEFLCMAGEVAGSADLLEDNTAYIHGIGVNTADIAAMADELAGLVWSPRSNVSLYGFTADVTIYHRLGVQISLGSDWPPSGSMSQGRELQCADYLNQAHYDGYFTDRQLVEMVTHNAAELTGFADVLGTLSVGKVGDVAIFDAAMNTDYRAVIDAGPGDVALVLRGGIALYGDTALVDALAPADGCDAVEFCGVAKRICVSREVGQSYDEIEAAANGSGNEKYTNYPLYFCDVPDGEPTCVPSRPDEFTGLGTMDDPDGDGLVGAADNCPTVFNPPRPMDQDAQTDTDGDDVGDACDPCPLDPDTEACTSVDPFDLDQDGVPNITDNCPGLANPEQENKDGDARGDACDTCPDYPDPCLESVYEIKKGNVGLGTIISLPPMVVTAITSNGYFVQLPPEADSFQGAEYSGIFVFDQTNAPTVAMGALIQVSGSVDDYFGQTQVAASSMSVVDPAASPIVPTPVGSGEVATAGLKAAAFEGVLIRVQNVCVTAVEPPTDETAPTGELEVTGGLLVDDLLYTIEPKPSVGECLQGIDGVLRFAWANTKITPRNADDVLLGPPKLKAFGPELVFATEGTSGPTAPPLTLSLTSPAQTPVTVSLVSADPTIAAPTLAEVVIPVGVQSVTVDVEAKVADLTPVVFTATAGEVELTASVRVLSTDAEPTIISLDPAEADLGTGKTIVLTATLDLPAGAGGLEVAVTADPAGLVTAPSSFIVPEGALEASFEVDALATAGIVTITAGSATATITIVEKPALGPVIVEVYYDHPGGDDGFEWVKIWNDSAATLDLKGYSLGWGGANYAWSTVNLTGTLAPGACFIVGGPASDPASGSPTIDQPFQLNMQNGGDKADGVALFDMPDAEITASTVPIDAVIYSGPNTSNLIDKTGTAPANAMVDDAPAGQSLLRVGPEAWEINPTPNVEPCTVL